MPITDYQFENRIFFAKESGVISTDDAQTWSDRLKDVLQTSDLPVVVVVDAMDVTLVHNAAKQIFIESASFDNLLTSIVATNRVVTIQAKSISMGRKQGRTLIFTSPTIALKEAEAIIQRESTNS